MSRKLIPNGNNDGIDILGERSDVSDRVEVEVLDESVIVQVADRIVYGQSPYQRDFTQSDLTMDNLAISHGLFISNGALKVVLFNDQRLEVQPTDVEIVDENNARVNLRGYTPIQGTWRLRAV